MRRGRPDRRANLFDQLDVALRERSDFAPAVSIEQLKEMLLVMNSITCWRSIFSLAIWSASRYGVRAE